MSRNLFKLLSKPLSDVLDYNCKYTNNAKGDGKRVRKYARRKLKQEAEQKLKEINK